MTEPVNFTMFGGAKFDSSQIAQKRTVQENGKTMYEVSFKNGGSVKYPKQAANKNASIFAQLNESVLGRTHDVEINNFSGAKFVGSEAWQDVVHLNGSDNSTIDVRGGNNMLEDALPGGGDLVVLENNKSSSGNKVLTDSKDNVMDKEAKIWTRGAGVHTEGDKTDINKLSDLS